MVAGLSANVISWKYTDDDGNNWRRRAEKALTDQMIDAAVAVGGVAGVPTDEPFAKSFIIPRYALVQSAGGVNRRVVCYTNNAPLLTLGATINLTTGGLSVAFITTGKTRERIKRVGSTNQSS